MASRALQAPFHAANRAEGFGEVGLLSDLLGREEGGAAGRSGLGLRAAFRYPVSAWRLDGKIGTYVLVE